MKVLFVNTNRIRPPIGPVALDYVGAVLQQEGHEVGLLDLCWAEDRDTAVTKALGRRDYDVVALTFRNTDDCYFASMASFYPVLMEDVAAIRSRFEGPLIVGGCGFSLMPIPITKGVGADFGVLGDGEVALPAFLQALQGAIPFDRVPGLAYLAEDGWRQNPAAVADIEKLVLSTRAIIDNRRYFLKGGQAGIETKRGCSSRCLYCADPVIKGRRSRLRSPSDVVREFNVLLEQGVDCFHLCDSEFNVPASHAFDVCRAIVHEGLGDKMQWYTYATPMPFPADLAYLMKQAGCAGINFGIDSGSDRMLSALGRDFTAADIKHTATVCREVGMTFMFDLLLGGPGEVWESVDETIELVNVASPSCVGVSLGLRIYPGTPLANWLAGSEQGRREVVGALGDTSPCFYLSKALGPTPLATFRDKIGDDPRYFLPVGDDEQDYNYNDNAVLQQAIDDGARGAYWDILRKIPKA